MENHLNGHGAYGKGIERREGRSVSDMAGLGTRDTIVPRGPREWGDLLYQEPWAYERRIPMKHDLLRVVGIDVFGSVILLMGLAFLIDGEPLLAAMYMVPALLLLVGSANLLVKLRHTLPFRVYRRGVTLPGKEPMREYREGDHYVPFEEVLAVAVKQDEWRGGPSSFLKFDVRGDLEDEERIVSLARGVEVAPIVEALNKAVPDIEVEQVA
jgi:hypothetical protein